MSSINGGFPIAMLDCWWYVTCPTSNDRVRAAHAGIHLYRLVQRTLLMSFSVAYLGKIEDHLGRIQKKLGTAIWKHILKKSAWKVCSNVYKWLILLFPSDSQLIICLIERHNIIQSPTALSGQSWSVVVRLCRGEGQLWHGLALGFDSCCEDPKLGTPPDQDFQERMQWMCFIVWYISVVFEFWKNYFCGF